MNRCVVQLLHVILLAGLAIPAGAAAPATATPQDDLLRHLNQTVDWYRRVVALNQANLSAQDLLYRDAVQQDARQTMRLGLDYARAQATILSSGPTKPSTGKPAKGQQLAQAAATAADRIAQIRLQLDRIDARLREPSSGSVPTSTTPSATTATTTPATSTAATKGTTAPATTAPSLAALRAQRDKLLAQLELALTRQDVLNHYSGFMSGVAGGGNELLEKVDDLERSMPELRAEAAGGAVAATQPAGDTKAAERAFHPESSGVVGLVTEAFSVSEKLTEIKALTDQTAALVAVNEKVRAPLRTTLIETSRRADVLGAAQSTDPQKLAADRDELQQLTTRFRQLATTAVPLGEQGALLNTARESLLAWRASLEHQYHDIVRHLLVRVFVMGSIILVILVISALWRRATFRYVHDTRRRRQFMLLRRIIVGCIISAVIAISFATEFGSLATFAGILTAGIAVALQTVILSGVAYFFFIGRYGVRVGDRITVAGVTGEVIDTGLFRLYLMELGGVNKLHATGRVVVFSNSVLFQSSAFYKQLPGADYVWHEVALTLSPDSDHELAEKRLLGAVRAVFDGYRKDIERQHAAVTAATHLQIDSPEPEGRLRFVDTGLEFVVRYPAEISRAEAVDDQVTRKLLAAIELEPKLKLVASGTPKIQPAQ